MTREQTWQRLVEMGVVAGEMPYGPFKMRGADLKGADLKGADLAGADLIGANLRGANLVGANLVGSYLMGSYLIGSYLIGAYLEGAYLMVADLREADLREATLERTDLVEANLRGANLRGANLRGTNLKGADLREANLMVADLRGADLEGANLEGANLEGADIEAAGMSSIDRSARGGDKKISIIFEPFRISNDEVLALLLSLSELCRAISGEGIVVLSGHEIVPITTPVKSLLMHHRLSTQDKRLIKETRRKLQIDLAGKNPETFDQKFSELKDMIFGTFESLLASKGAGTARADAKDMPYCSKDFIKTVFQKPSLEKLRIMSEIEDRFASAEEKMGAAQKIFHEAPAVKKDNALHKLREIFEILSVSSQMVACSNESGVPVIEISAKETQEENM
jgi:hypothetical protein